MSRHLCIFRGDNDMIIQLIHNFNELPVTKQVPMEQEDTGVRGAQRTSGDSQVGC